LAQRKTREYHYILAMLRALLVLLLAAPSWASGWRAAPAPSIPALPMAAAGLPNPPFLYPGAQPAFPTMVLLPRLRSLGVVVPASVGFQPFAAAAAAAKEKPSSLTSLSSLGAKLAVPAASAAPEGELEPFWTGTERRGDAGLSKLDAVVAAARRSKTGREILDKVDFLARERGPLPIEIKELRDSELGHYDYSLGILALDRAHASGDPRVAAATLLHELVHVLQHAGGQAPAEALEMELEAHAVSIKVLDELGVPEDERDTFSRELKRLLRDEGPAAYEAWLAEQLSGKLRRSDGAEDIVDVLENDAERWWEAASRGKRGRDRLIALAERSQADAEKLKTKKGRAAYARFAARVRALLGKEHRRLRRAS
jgi:hypothetical protein